VVTNSYYSDTPGGYDVATAEELNQWPALIAAAMDPDRFSPQYADQLADQQPPKQFFIKRQEYGTFLIGALLKDGTSFGMTSSSKIDQYPDGITAFALGEGYGTVDANNHLTSSVAPGDRGTSLAAPAVAVQLYLARALWKVEHAQVDQPATGFGTTDAVGVMEAKRRLTLSAAVDPILIGKAAAAGIPQFERLIAPSGDVIITQDNLVKSVVVSGARVKMNDHQLDYTDRRHGFGGIQVNDGHVFVYDETMKAWARADDDGFEIELQGEEPITDPRAFSAAYKSLLRYY